MRSPTMAALAAFVSFWVPNATSQSLAHLDATQVHRWREDLAVLREEMPLRHANLFHRMTRAQFDSALGSIEQQLPLLARHQVIVALQQLCALIGDGHSNVSPWRDSAAAFHELPISLYWFEDGVIVRAAGKEHADLVGARVLAVGGVPIEEAIARVRPLISRDNEMGVTAWTPLLLTMPEVLHSVGLTVDPTRANFSFSTATGQRTVTLTPAGLFPMLTGETDLTWKKRDGWVDSNDHNQAPLWLSDITNTYWFRYLSETRTLYCQLNAIQQKPDDSLRVFLARALNVADSVRAERFVLDLRLNGGGNGYWNKDILRSLIKSRYDERGRLAVIIGRRTWSAAQMLIAEIEKYTNAIFVGEPSSSRGNAFGDSRRIILPNSHVIVRVSTLWHQYWDPRDTRQWITPEISTPLFFRDYAAGLDPALEASMRLSLY
jgi:hypothetical protein